MEPQTEANASTPAPIAGTQRWDANLYDDKHSFVWKHGAALVDLLDPRPGERVLDLGCGTGHLTAQIVTRGALVVGLDSGPEMISQARREYPLIHFEHGNARDFFFPKPFDAVFSNAVLHWVKEPERVIACVQRALKAGGRFVAEFGGQGNVRTIVAGMAKVAAALGLSPFEDPWYFPSIGSYTRLLEEGEFEVSYAALFDRPTPLEGEQGMRHWIEMFGGAMLGLVPMEQRQDFLQRVEDELRPMLYRAGSWYADYRRLRVVAQRVSA